MDGASSSSSKPSGVQGVCPDGWHVPSDEEWKELEIHLGMNHSEADDLGYRGTNQGSKLAGNVSIWNSGDLINDSEFGSRGYNGSFLRIGDYGHGWSSTENSSTIAWYRSLSYGVSYVYRYYSLKDYDFSVRCVRDLKENMYQGSKPSCPGFKLRS